MKVGLTGGIGSGKTTVASMFEDLGVPVYYSDSEAKKLMNTSKPLIKKIKSLLGEASYVDGTLDRPYVAKKVFSSPELLDQLNGMVHPAVRRHFKSWYRRQSAPYVIQEAAIIFEQGTEGLYDKVILVTAPLELRMARVMERDGTDRESIVSRMEHQWPDAKKIPLADYVLENTDLNDTRDMVNELHKVLMAHR